MARAVGFRPRVADAITLGMLAKRLLVSQIKEVLREQGRESQRERQLPAHLVVYYVIAPALYMEVSTREVLRYLQKGARWLLGPAAKVKVTGKLGISAARTRPGWEPMKARHDQIVRPIAVRETKGAWYRGWRLASLDGSTLAVRDTKANREVFGKPGASRGQSGFPQLRFVSVLENGTHVLFGTALGAYPTINLPTYNRPCLRSGAYVNSIGAKNGDRRIIPLGGHFDAPGQAARV